MPRLKTNLITALMVLMALLAPSPVAAGSVADISGEYRGTFKYFDSNRQEVTGNFTIQIRQTGEHISGTITEPRTDFGPEQMRMLVSDFSGAVWPARGGYEVIFVKTYRYDSHTILYEGHYNPQSGVITGRWRIGSYQGSFTISGVYPGR